MVLRCYIIRHLFGGDMNYIFEDTIRFDVEDRSLTHVETNDNIALAMSGCVLLEYLIQHQGAVITRNRLLDDIFKKNELVDSDSNLSQNISMLRKGFRDLGVDKDILVTKPRIGLLLPEDVKVSSVSQATSRSASWKFGKKSCIKTLYFMLSFLVVSLFFGWSGLQSSRIFSTFPVSKAVSLGGCKVHILDKVDDAKTRIAALIQKESLQCEEQDIFYYLENDLVNTRFESLVRCRNSASGEEVCENYLFRNAL